LESSVPSNSDADRIQRVKERFFTVPDSETQLNPALLQSWQRSKDALGTPGNLSVVPLVDESVLDGHLLDVFQAPLARVADDLSGTGFGLLLADAQGRILQRWSHDRAAVNHLDSLGTVRGAVLAEDAVGTNGVGTVAATGHSFQVTGPEHFAEFYSGAICTGAPVRHPVSRKLLGVVTVSSQISERGTLLKALVNSVSAQLEQQLLDVETPAAQRLYVEFMRASQLHSGPVLAFGPRGLVIQSRKASRLSSGDLALIEQRCGAMRGPGNLVVELSAGTAEIRVTHLDKSSGYLVMMAPAHQASSTSIGPARSQLIGRACEWLEVTQDVARHRGSRRPLLITGEAGAGKTSLALGLPWRGRTDATSFVFDAAERHLLGNRRWLQKIAARLEAAAPLVVRGIETLDQGCLDALRALVDQNERRGTVMLTMTTDQHKRAEQFAARLGMDAVWVPPLRERTVDIPLFWRYFAGLLSPGAGLEPRPEAAELLKAHAWPGNVKELRIIVEQMTLTGKRGAVHPGDLPEQVRSARALSMIERVEFEAIRRALQEADGNRSRAAAILGLSRATIYRKIRTYRLTA
jgi:sigma-54 dependent transcriptional regulator, acetoin dehydrogenase operon transcriptional activator AcoR